MVQSLITYLTVVCPQSFGLEPEIIGALRESANGRLPRWSDDGRRALVAALGGRAGECGVGYCDGPGERSGLSPQSSARVAFSVRGTRHARTARRGLHA